MATQHYTDLGFNEPDFPEYDATPYGGGYDIATTYGKPLPPSTKICYPKDISVSTPREEESVGHKPNQENGFIPPPPLSNELDFNTPVEPNLGGNGYVPNGYNDLVEDDYDYPSGVSLPQEIENGYYGTQVPLPPSDYVEPCASFFGYWPCLLKDYQKNAAQQCCKQQAYADGWRKTEEYFFGSSYPYGERRGDGVSHVDYQYGYNRHCIEQPNYVLEEYNPKVLSSEVSFNYGYERHYKEPPSYVQEDCNMQTLSHGVNFDCGYERKYFDHPTYVQDDLPVQSRDLSTQVDFNYGYEKHYMEQPSYMQDDYGPQTWSQRLSYDYYESYEEV